MKSEGGRFCSCSTSRTCRATASKSLGLSLMRFQLSSHPV